MNRTDFQKLARMRVREPKALLESGHFSGAYYLAGYSVECALKSCIAKSTARHDFPDKHRVQESHTHNLLSLLKLADLQSQFTQDKGQNPILAGNWNTVQQWSETSRYSIKTQVEAQEIVRAITGRSGVMRWVTQRW